jgi:hypothetical protein
MRLQTMATLIPALGACVARMTSGERRLAERLEQKLDTDYLLWYDVPVGALPTYPDFLVLHPSRGILVLEVKDWRLGSITYVDKATWVISPDGTSRHVDNPLDQARQHAHMAVKALERDPQLVHADGPHCGKLATPWSYGVVLTNITRKQFEATEMQRAIPSNRVICQDEMLESVEPEALQSRLWDMFPYGIRRSLSLPQIDRVRWHLFPQLRVPTQGAFFDATAPDAELPDILRVMDLQQEQLARSLGDGHRVIHGVAGSGKTMILGYRAEHLARAGSPQTKPILVLCYNEPLAMQLASVMVAKGLGERVHVRHFHKWCRDQLQAYGLALPRNLPINQYVQELVQLLIRAVTLKHIPGGQYQAVLIDEGHDFAPEWLTLVTQMVDPATNSLLVLYDDAQSIYERSRTRQFSFKSVGIQAQGRTTILKLNYRNTRQILQTATLVAGELLTADDQSEDGIPLLAPLSCGRDGEAPLLIRLPDPAAEANRIAELLHSAHQEGHAWNDMAVLCRHRHSLDTCAQALRRHRLPHQVRKGGGDFQPGADTIKVLTMHASKGLEFSVVALMGVGHMPAEGCDERDEARLFYVAATRATRRLVVGMSGDGSFGKRLG